MRNLVIAKIIEIWDDYTADELGFGTGKLSSMSNKDLLALLIDLMDSNS
jgi:hypothetical protein